MHVKPNATVFLHATDDQEVIIVVNNCKGKYSICKRSFESSVFPDKMKVAKVIPIYKSGNTYVFPTTGLCHFDHNLNKL